MRFNNKMAWGPSSPRGLSVSDEEVARAKEGDAQAWAEIYEEYYDRLFRYFRSRLSEREVAEDLAAQVFVKAMAALPAYRFRGAPFAAWLFRIAANLVVDHHRRAASRQRYLRNQPPPPPTNSLHEEVEAQMEREEVMAAVGQLTPAQQEVIRLRFAAGLSTAETAQALGKSLAAVKSLQHQALITLRQLLRGYE